MHHCSDTILLNIWRLEFNNLNFLMYSYLVQFPESTLTILLFLKSALIKSPSITDVSLPKKRLYFQYQTIKDAQNKIKSST